MDTGRRHRYIHTKKSKGDFALSVDSGATHTHTHTHTRVVLYVDEDCYGDLVWGQQTVYGVAFCGLGHHVEDASQPQSPPCSIHIKPPKHTHTHTHTEIETKEEKRDR